MTTIAFMDCRLETSARRLTRGGEAVAVEPQVFDLLVFLASHAGEALTKEAILAEIWDGRAVSDEALTSRIRAARKAIGDHERRAIRTLHKVGYIFDAEVWGARVPASAGRHPVEARFLQHEGRSVAWVAEGDGPDLIFPAWWVSNIVEDTAVPRVAAFFERLAQGFRLIRYDRPGSGMSDRGARSSDLDDEVSILGAVMEAAGATRAHLYAQSMAVPVSMAFAARHPDRVGRIVTFGGGASGAEMAPVEVRDAMVNLVRVHWGIGSRVLSDIFMPSADAEALEGAARLKRHAADAEVAADVLRLAYTLDAGDAVERVRAPVLVMHREGDRAVPARAARALAARLPDARLAILPGDSHLPWEGDDLVAARANGFFRDGV